MASSLHSVAVEMPWASRLPPLKLMHPCTWVGDAPDAHDVLSCLCSQSRDSKPGAPPPEAVAVHPRGSADSWEGSCSAGVRTFSSYHRARSVRRPDVNPPMEAPPRSRNSRDQRPSSAPQPQG